MQLKYKIDLFNAKTERQYKEGLIEEQVKRTNLEKEQMQDGNPYNDKIKKKKMQLRDSI